VTLALNSGILSSTLLSLLSYLSHCRLSTYGHQVFSIAALRTDSLELITQQIPRPGTWFWQF